MTKTAFFPGSFDPVTFGHLDLIARAASLCDQLVIGVGAHHEKRALFTAAERISMLREVAAPIAGKIGMEVQVTSFDTLTVDAARAANAAIILRGVRDAADFAYEMQMAGMNANIKSVDKPPIETFFLPASPHVRHIAAKFVRQIAAMGGDVSRFVPDHVAARLDEKFA